MDNKYIYMFVRGGEAIEYLSIMSRLLVKTFSLIENTTAYTKKRLLDFTATHGEGSTSDRLQISVVTIAKL